MKKNTQNHAFNTARNFAKAKHRKTPLYSLLQVYFLYFYENNFYITIVSTKAMVYSFVYPLYTHVCGIKCPCKFHQMMDNFAIKIFNI